MKKILNYLFAALLCTFPLTPASAATVAEEISRVAGEVANLELGFGRYILGKTLTDEQKKFAFKNPIEKALEGTYKFRDDEVYVVASRENDTVLGVYKVYHQASMDNIKDIVGTLMLEYGEPTAVAHEKLVYWSYNKSGKISQEDFDFSRQSGGMDSLAAVKFSSSEPIASGSAEGERQENAENQKPVEISAYVMITSDPLSKLFLANTAQGQK